MTIRYFVESKLGTDAWIVRDYQAGHISYAYCKRLAQNVKRNNPLLKVRVTCRITKTDEFTVEEI